MNILRLLTVPLVELSAIAWQNTAYNQPPHPSFALDESLPLPPPPVVEFPHSPPVP